MSNTGLSSLSECIDLVWHGQPHSFQCSQRFLFGLAAPIQLNRIANVSRILFVIAHSVCLSGEFGREQRYRLIIRLLSLRTRSHAPRAHAIKSSTKFPHRQPPHCYTCCVPIIEAFNSNMIITIKISGILCQYKRGRKTIIIGLFSPHRI